MRIRMIETRGSIKQTQTCIQGSFDFMITCSDRFSKNTAVYINFYQYAFVYTYYEYILQVLNPLGSRTG